MSVSSVCEPSYALDIPRFEAVERPIAFAMVNAIIAIQLDLQKTARLRPEECLVFLVIVVATVQRLMRAPEISAELLTRRQLPPEHRGHISRRRIAEALGLPVETVRRHVDRLLQRQLVVESGRGRISTPGGTLAMFSEDGTTLSVARQFLGVVRTMDRLGALSRPRTAP
ncbi:MAG: winged helix-turn-helix transcriptional regulator [Tabrizicola sp.]